jgi:hypothetical protein
MIDQAVGFKVPVVLADDDCRLVREFAARVDVTARQRGWQHKWTPPGTDMVAQAAHGYGAELAVARLTGLSWNSRVLDRNYSKRHKVPDVGQRVEVRWSGYELWSRSNDQDAWLYVLVSGRMPRYVINGWIEGNEFRIERYWREGSHGRPPGYMLPHTDLRPLPLPIDA